MVVSKKKNNPECKLFSKGEQIRQVQKFKYLGYTLTSNGKYRTEIKKRIASAKASFQKMSTILKNRNIISFSTKLKVLKTCVVYTFIWMRNLDNNCRNQEKFRGSGNVVLQENVKNIMERKKDKRIDIRKNEPREIPHKNNKEKATEIFRPHMSP